MADVVDIPEFRAFYYTDDTPRQFYTLRRYEDESGSGKMHCYNIAPGIQLSFNDLNLSSCYQPLNVQKDFLEINYCLEGGHEVEMVGGGITFLGEKDLSISGLYHDKRVIVNSRTEKVSRRTQQVYQYIIENPFTQKNISEIAEIYGVSESSMKRCFKSISGASLGTFMLFALANLILADRRCLPA